MKNEKNWQEKIGQMIAVRKDKIDFVGAPQVKLIGIAEDGDAEYLPTLEVIVYDVDFDDLNIVSTQKKLSHKFFTKAAPKTPQVDAIDGMTPLGWAEPETETAAELEQERAEWAKLHVDELAQGNPVLKLRRQILDGAFKVETIKGPDSGDCPSPKCIGGNAMICQGECPAGFEPHHFWKLGLHLTACRDCGHSVIATRNPDWKMPSVAELNAKLEN